MVARVSAYSPQLTQDARHVYWSASNITRIDKLTGNVQTIVKNAVPTNAGAPNIAVDADFVYWSDVVAVYRAPKTGGVGQQLSCCSSPSYEIAVDNSSLYVLVETDSFLMDQPGIRAWRKPDGPAQWVALGTSPSQLTLSGGNLYWGDLDQEDTLDRWHVWRVSTRGGPVESVFVEAGRAAFTVQGDVLYGGTGASIWRMRLPHGTRRPLAMASSAVRQLIAGPRCLYVRDQDGLWRMPLDGGPLVPVAVAPDPGSPVAWPGTVLLDAHYLYWAEPGKVLRLPLD